MTDDVAIMLNLITLAESGEADFKLEVSRTHYNLREGVPYKLVFVNGMRVAAVKWDDLSIAAVDWVSLRSDTIKKYEIHNWPGRRI